ncbi:hypothetical protein BC828DRAFT_19060 [Blastocladiella britannica]|nr:hypothetical protein BC828DRAFT_19060 [Blastocladiella britannica]
MDALSDVLQTLTTLLERVDSLQDNTIGTSPILQHQQQRPPTTTQSGFMGHGGGGAPAAPPLQNMEPLTWQGVPVASFLGTAFILAWISTSVILARRSALEFPPTNLTWPSFIKSHAGRILTTAAFVGVSVAGIPTQLHALVATPLHLDAPALARSLAVLTTLALVRRALVHVSRRQAVVTARQDLHRAVAAAAGRPARPGVHGLVVAEAANAILHAWCAAGAGVAGSAAVRDMATRGARGVAAAGARAVAAWAPAVMASRWTPPTAVVVAYAGGTWVWRRIMHPATTESAGRRPWVRVSEVATLALALVSWQYLSAVVGDGTTITAAQLGGSAGLVLALGAALAIVALHTTAWHASTSSSLSRRGSAVGTPSATQHRSPSVVRRSLTTPSIAAQAMQLPHASAREFARPASPALKRRALASVAAAVSPPVAPAKFPAHVPAWPPTMEAPDGSHARHRMRSVSPSGDPAHSPSSNGGMFRRGLSPFRMMVETTAPYDALKVADGTPRVHFPEESMAAMRGRSMDRRAAGR